jgi:hypothetical protein
MSYTKAFNHLHRLSYAIDLKQDVQYKRVAVYIGRIFMAEAERCHTDDADFDFLDMPIRKESMHWVEKLYGHKDMMLDFVVGINDYEWRLIQKAMIGYANLSRGSAVWVGRRHSWITQLDTLRAFN